MCQGQLGHRINVVGLGRLGLQSPMQVIDLFNSPLPPMRLLTTLSAVRVRPGEPKIKHLHLLSESRSPIESRSSHSALLVQPHQPAILGIRGRVLVAYRRGLIVRPDEGDQIVLHEPPGRQPSPLWAHLAVSGRFGNQRAGLSIH